MITSRASPAAASRARDKLSSVEPSSLMINSSERSV